MCIRERKTYIHSDGERTVEHLRLCHRAVGKRPCNRIERRNTEPVRVVEVRPPTERTSSDGLLITEGFNGRQTRYRDVSVRSSNSSSLRRSMTMGELSPISYPSSVSSSPSIIEVKPEAPSPPPAVPGFAFSTRTQSPTSFMAPSTPPLLARDLPISPPDPFRTVTADGHAIYDRPPSMELPRALHNERSEAQGPQVQASTSSRRSEVDSATEPGLSSRRRRPSITIDTTRRPTSPPVARQTDLEPLPQRTSSHRDGQGSARASKRSSRPIVQQQDPPTSSTVKAEEDDRQARLERQRLAATDLRQPARDQLARDASRERHRREAAEALERGPLPRSESSIEENIRAEREQMAREQREAAHRRRRRESDVDEASRRFAEDYVYRDAEGTIRWVTDRDSTASARSPRYSIDEAFARTAAAGASSPRLSRNPPSAAVQQPNFSPRRWSSTFRERGEEVIAREQTRAATERLTEAFGEVGLSDRERERDRYTAVREEDEEYDVVIGADGRRRRRRRSTRNERGGASARRDRPPQQFHR